MKNSPQIIFFFHKKVIILHQNNLPTRTRPMRSIFDIFPNDYPHPHDEEDLRFEVQDLLQHAHSPMDIILTINKIKCPYYRKAIATLVPNYWHSMERDGKEPAVFLDGDGDWRISWSNIDYDMRAIIKKANAEQIELEQTNDATLNQFTLVYTTTPTQPQNNTSMKKKSSVQITNNFYAPIGQMISNVEKLEAHFDKDMTMHIDGLNLTEQKTVSSAPTYSTYLRRQLGLGKSDDEVQTNLQNAAQAGATALVRYLTSNEGKIYFDFRGQNKSKIITTLNQELGTSISEKAFCAALNRNGLQL